MVDKVGDTRDPIFDLPQSLNNNTEARKKLKEKRGIACSGSPRSEQLIAMFKPVTFSIGCGSSAGPAPPCSGPSDSIDRAIARLPPSEPAGDACAFYSPNGPTTLSFWFQPQAEQDSLKPLQAPAVETSRAQTERTAERPLSLVSSFPGEEAPNSCIQVNSKPSSGIFPLDQKEESQRVSKYLSLFAT